MTKLGNFRAELPWLANALKRVSFLFGSEMNLIFGRLSGYAEESIERYWRQLRADPGNAKPTLLTKEYARIEDGTMTAAQLRRDATGYIVAGTDTTAVTATYAVWFLAQYPDVQERLIREVAALPEDFSDENLKHLQVLDGVMNETLRLRAAVSQCLPRVVPSDGAEFCGYFVPADATVGIQAWTMHRNPTVWPRPEVFDPSRWENPTKEMKDSFVPFGGGSRGEPAILAKLEVIFRITADTLLQCASVCISLN